MFSIALSVSLFHTLALLGLLAAFALDNSRRVKLPANRFADAVAARQPTDEEILMMVAAPVGARVPSQPQPQPQPQPQSGVARAA